MRRIAFLLCAVAGAGLAAQAAEAGIVVYENGNVLQGPIEAGDVTSSSVTVHHPRVEPKGATIRGQIVVPRSEIRWFDATRSDLEEDYYEKFGDKPLDPKWARWFSPGQHEPEGPIARLDVKAFLENGLSRARYTKSWTEGDLSVRPPSGATAHEGEVVAFELERGARVHVCSSLAPKAVPSAQLGWVEDALSRVANEGGFDVEGSPAVVPVPGGHDARIETVTHHGSETIRALRLLSFRPRRTYLVSCYAPDAEFADRRKLFEALLDSVRIDEGEPVDLALVQQGQTWRWRSATRPDALVWEVTGKDVHVLRYHETVEGTPTKRELSAPARLDARALLVAATHVPATPEPAGEETLEVSGTKLACRVYQAESEGKTYRLWLSPSFPAPIKVMAGSTVVRELAEIKR